MTARTTGLALAAALAALPAFAGRPLSTEDASTLRDHACQVEAWVDRYRESTQSWLVPACNFGAGIEWQLGAARTREAGRSVFSEGYFQAKTVRWLEGSPWGVGLVAGVTRKPLAESHRGWSNPYLLLPLSVAAGTSGALLHLNIGASHDRAERRTVTVWAVGAEAPIAARTHLVAEAFGENAGRPFVRAGLRFTALTDLLDLDLTAVAKPGGTRDERHVSVGLTWVSP